MRAELSLYHEYNSGRLTSIKIQRTVHLETTDGLDFKTPKFPHHVIYSRYRLDKENPYMQKNLYVLFWMIYALFVESESLN